MINMIRDIQLLLPLAETLEMICSGKTENGESSASVIKTCPSNTFALPEPVFSFLCCDPNFPDCNKSLLERTQ